MFTCMSLNNNKLMCREKKNALEFGLTVNTNSLTDNRYRLKEKREKKSCVI